MPNKPTDAPNDRDHEKQDLTSGGLLARNALWNLLSQSAPIAAAIFTIPVLIAGIGTDRFGVFTLAWMVLGYFSLFDLGLGRALTKMVAEKLGRGLERELPSLVGTALSLMMILGLAGAIAIALVSPTLVRHILKVPTEIQGEALAAFYMMAAALPFLISTAGLRGVMEAHQRFGMINVVRTAIGLFSLIGPILVLPFSRSLVPVVAVVFVGRLISWAIHMVLCLRTIPDLGRGFAIRTDLVKPLITFGGWMTLTNIINPLMVQMDRFAVGALISTAAVAYYTTPYELVTKFWFLSNSILGVMFPAFATSFVLDRARTALFFGRTVKYIFMILFPITLAAVTLAPEVLTLWLGADFAGRSTLVMQCLALGVFLNGLAQVPSALIQGVGRPDLTFKLHLIELFPYLLTAWFLIRWYGIEGAALAWTARTALDLVLFFRGGRLILPESEETVRRLTWALAVTVPLIALGAMPLGLAWRAAYLALVAIAAPPIVWRRVLTAEEKLALLNRFVSVWSRCVPRRAAGFGIRTATEATNSPSWITER